jgi:hypothetical protein
MIIESYDDHFFSNMTNDTTNYKIQISLKPKTFITTFVLCNVYSKKQEARQLSQYSDGLQAGWSGIDSRQMQGFSSVHSIQTGSRDHPAYYLMGTKALSPGGKATGKRSLPLTS